MTYQGGPPPWSSNPVPPPPPIQPPKKSRTGLIIGVVVGALVLLGGCGVIGAVAIAAVGGAATATPTASTTVPVETPTEPTEEPTTATPTETTEEPSETSSGHKPATSEEKWAMRVCKKAVKNLLTYPGTATFSFESITPSATKKNVYGGSGMVTAKSKNGERSSAFFSCTATREGDTMRARAKLIG